MMARNARRGNFNCRSRNEKKSWKILKEKKKEKLWIFISSLLHKRAWAQALQLLFALLQWTIIFSFHFSLREKFKNCRFARTCETSKEFHKQPSHDWYFFIPNASNSLCTRQHLQFFFFFSMRRSLMVWSEGRSSFTCELPLKSRLDSRCWKMHFDESLSPPLCSRTRDEQLNGKEKSNHCARAPPLWLH